MPDLREWLTQEGIKQRTLAKQLGVDEATVSRVATGGQAPSGDFILRFFQVYGQDETCKVFDLPAVPANGNGSHG